MQRALGEHASAVRSQPYYLDVTHADANKGNVITTLSRLLSIPPGEIATIGDMPNDVLMFRASGMSIAMGNASPEVQKEAQFVTSLTRKTVRQGGAAIHPAGRAVGATSSLIK